MHTLHGQATLLSHTEREGDHEQLPRHRPDLGRSGSWPCAALLLVEALVGAVSDYQTSEIGRLKAEVEALRQEVRECSSIEDDTPPGPP